LGAVKLEPFNYQAALVRVVDGDTAIMRIDLGFHMSAEVSIRLLGVNTSELRSKDPNERLKAENAKIFSETWFATGVAASQEADPFRGWPYVVQTSKGDSFGRWLGRVWNRRTGEELNQALLDSGHAVVFRS
jgi:endonuclease YncB( thermonuclease family)